MKFRMDQLEICFLRIITLFCISFKVFIAYLSMQTGDFRLFFSPFD
jgi:hypothetical protein